MCEITHREAIRLSIKDKLKVLQKKEPVLAELFQHLLDLDEEAQKLPFTSVPINPIAPYQPYRSPSARDLAEDWWNNPYKITMTSDTSTSHYSLEADATT